jgi:hypothetical protein
MKMLETEDNKLMVGGLVRRHRAVHYKSAQLTSNHTSGFPLPSLAEALRISLISLDWFSAHTRGRDKSDTPQQQGLSGGARSIADSPTAAQKIAAIFEGILHFVFLTEPQRGLIFVVAQSK